MSYAQAQNDADNSGPAGDFDGLVRCRHCKAMLEDHWPWEGDVGIVYFCDNGDEFEELDIDALREAQQERMAEERAGA